MIISWKRGVLYQYNTDTSPFVMYIINIYTEGSDTVIRGENIGESGRTHKWSVLEQNLSKAQYSIKGEIEDFPEYFL